MELKSAAIKLKITLCDRWPIFTTRCSNTFKIWTFLYNSLYIISKKWLISKKSVQYHCRWNLKQYAIKLKITQCDRWPIFTPRWTKDFEFGHVIANITITLISLKISRYYRSSNSKHCGSNWDFEFQHFSEIISISWISKKIYLIIIEVAT